MEKWRAVYYHSYLLKLYLHAIYNAIRKWEEVSIRRDKLSFCEKQYGQCWKINRTNELLQLGGHTILNRPLLMGLWTDILM